MKMPHQDDDHSPAGPPCQPESNTEPQSSASSDAQLVANPKPARAVSLRPQRPARIRRARARKRMDLGVIQSVALCLIGVGDAFTSYWLAMRPTPQPSLIALFAALGLVSLAIGNRSWFKNLIEAMRHSSKGVEGVGRRLAVGYRAIVKDGATKKKRQANQRKPGRKRPEKE